MQGDYSAIPHLFRDLIGRSMLVGIGVKMAGGTWKDAARYGAAGALSIEAFVLAYAVVKTAQHREP